MDRSWNTDKPRDAKVTQEETYVEEEAHLGTVITEADVAEASDHPDNKDLNLSLDFRSSWKPGSRNEQFGTFTFWADFVPRNYSIDLHLQVGLHGINQVFGFDGNKAVFEVSINPKAIAKRLKYVVFRHQSPATEHFSEWIVLTMYGIGDQFITEKVTVKCTIRVLHSVRSYFDGLLLGGIMVARLVAKNSVVGLDYNDARNNIVFISEEQRQGFVFEQLEHLDGWEFV